MIKYSFNGKCHEITTTKNLHNKILCKIKLTLNKSQLNVPLLSFSSLFGDASMPGHAHQRSHHQFVVSTDMYLHAKH